ncbi:MAG: AMP-binding protein [Clostridia bacterium]|nr:AMP-binding protein [Clostridia bacterium]
MSTTKVPNRKRMIRNLPHVWDVNDLLDLIKSHGDKVCYKYFEQGALKEMTYAEVYRTIHQVAAAFDKLELVGKRVAVIGDTSPQWLCTYVGALASGTVIIPMDKELELSQIEKFLEMVEADAIVYSKSFNEKFVTTINSHPTLKRFIPISSDYDSSFSEKVLPFADFLTIGQENLDAGYTVGMVKNRDAMCEMLFTSGTTGTSKCVMLSQKNIFAAVSSAIETVCFTSDDVLVSVLPVHHTYELMCLLAELAYGIETCINDSLRHVMKNFQLFKPTGLVLVPMFLNTMYKRIWSEAEKTGKAKVLKAAIKASRGMLKVGIDIRKTLFKSVLEAFGGRLDHIICGGAKLNPELIVAFEDFGISVFEGFGITECSPLVSVTPYYARKLGAIGPNVPCCRVRIDPNGEETPEGYPMGEVQVKGDNVMIGYYNNPEANAEVFTNDGWFRTGDVGYMDSDGYIYITGRIKFVIVLENGKNVFPEEIEEYLDTIDTISECCVIGRKNPDSDEIVLTAVVYPDFTKFPKDADEETVKESIRKAVNATNKKLPTYKQIKAVELRKTEFEKTTTKKIKRQLVK